jgi:hypothetical protein
MKLRHHAAGLCVALLLASTGASQVTANLDEEVDIQKDFSGGNATASGRAQARARLLLYYQAQPALLRYLMSTLEGRIIVYRYWLFWQLYGRPPAPQQAAPAPTPMPEPGDLPSESVLDQIEESDAPPVLVGMPGSGTALSAFDEIGNAEPPPADSILDQIDESPKPAVNQAAAPTVRPQQ